MDQLFFAQLFGLYFLIVGAVVVWRRSSFMPAIAELASNRGLIIVLGCIELVAGLALTLAYPKVSFTLEGFISLVGWMMLVEGIIYLALPAKEVQKMIKTFNKPKFYIWGGTACIIIGAYLAGVGFGYIAM